MTDQELVDRIEGLSVAQVCELSDCLNDYGVVMPGGERPNELEARLLLKTMLSILSWKQ